MLEASPLHSTKKVNSSIISTSRQSSNYLPESNLVSFAAYNPNTTYGMSYSPDYGKSARIKSIGKQVLASPCIKFQGVKLNSSAKPFLKVADEISSSLSNYGRKLSPLRLTNKLQLEADLFSRVVHKRQASVKVSSENINWLMNNEKKNNIEQIMKGEFIPTMNQLYLYGAREEKSLFEKRGLGSSLSTKY
jgi:hypothetical protein